MRISKAEYSKGLRHPFAPVVDARSKALVLGSFPSVKSRENAFYYGHPQNRFWRVLAALFEQSVPETIAEKTELLQRRHIALWDVVSVCDIQGSADNAIKPYRFKDIASCLRGTNITRIFANGQTAGRLYLAHAQQQVGIPIQVLPSTSPANAAWSLERLIEAWSPLKDAVSRSTGRAGKLS